MPFYDYKCSKCNNVQEEFHSIKKVTNDDKDYFNTLECKYCYNVGSMRRKISDTKFASYESATPNEKREMLKKRSRDHFQKKVVDKFHELNRKGNQII